MFEKKKNITKTHRQINNLCSDGGCLEWHERNRQVQKKKTHLEQIFREPLIKSLFIHWFNQSFNLSIWECMQCNERGNDKGCMLYTNRDVNPFYHHNLIVNCRDLGTHLELGSDGQRCVLMDCGTCWWLWTAFTHFECAILQRIYFHLILSSPTINLIPLMFIKPL